ncbi:PAS domain-containing protein [Tistrella mobilis]|uniref:PAS domain-containing protein n=1 Tax=Tistrella mobilis (strain KA081020-065) TaxID=1110502 RepID=I3TH66_TISMK|nr:PAS domain-containing protein [Tistrella mobilis]AFK52104.1 hypothetical protein TMO_0265 [Tistrella mobilis KA081020-065]
MDDFARQFETDILRLAYAYWRGLCGDAGMPLRRQIDPLDLRRLLPNLFIYDVVRAEDGSWDYRFRLVGTRISEAHGGDHRGRLLRDVHGDQWSRIEEDYHGVVRTGRPNFARRSGFAIGKDYVTYERILLPVSDAGDRVDALFGAAHYWMG